MLLFLFFIQIILLSEEIQAYIKTMKVFFSESLQYQQSNIKINKKILQMNKDSLQNLQANDIIGQNQLQIATSLKYDSKLENSKIQSFQFNDLESKTSSKISNGTHETSFDFSESSFQNEPLRAQDFIREESILSRKVCKKQLTLKDACFTSEFLKHVQEQIIKFCQYPDTLNFYNFVKNILKPNLSIFSIQDSKNQSNVRSLTVKQVMQGLVTEKTNWFFISTHSINISSLGFFVLLIIIWANPQVAFSITLSINNFRMQPQKKGKQFEKQNKIRSNIIQIVKIYVENHSPQINDNQVLLLLVLNFLDTLKKFSQSQSQNLSQMQIKLVKEVKIFRSMELSEKKFSKTNNQSIFQKKLRKYQESHSFITSSQSTYYEIKTHNLESFSSYSLQKLYQFDSLHQCRKQYQMKKDSFCLWILQNILKEGQNKSTSILHNSSMYIIEIMGMLKKMKSQDNIEGISYLIPIVANLKSFLPKVWKHVIKRRPDVQAKFNQYTELLLQNKYKIEHFGQSGIVWGQTLYTISQRVLKFFKNRKGIDIEQHKKYYNQFLSHIIFHRKKSQQVLTQRKLQKILQNQQASNIKISIIQQYLLKKYSKTNMPQSWNMLTRKAQKINQNINESLLTDIFDYCFIGSTQKYKRVDI